MKRLRATQMWISASRRLQSWAAGLLLFFFIFTPLISPFVSFPPFKGSLASALPQKPAGCLISCAAPRPFQSDGLLLCLIQAAVSARSYFAANTGGFLWFCFFFSPFHSVSYKTKDALPPTGSIKVKNSRISRGLRHSHRH